MKCSIIGVGKMGEAILRGLLSLAEEGGISLTGYEVSPQRRGEISKKYHVQLASSLEDAIEESDAVIVAVKPQQMEALLNNMGPLVGGRLLISVAAGITSAFIHARVSPEARIVRVMPNTPALVREGALAYALGPNAQEEDRRWVEALLSPLGKVVEVEEGLMDAVTALSGSGPAYVYLFMQSLSDAGVRVGLPRELANLLVFQTVKGSLKLMEETGSHPAQLMEMVTSPGGTTIAALHAMERAGIRGIVMDGVRAAESRARELAKEKQQT